MKKYITLLLSICCLAVTFGSCAFMPMASQSTSQSSLRSSSRRTPSRESSRTEKEEKEDSSAEEIETLKEYDRYSLETYMQPIWQGGIVYNETLSFVGLQDQAPLLYQATEIVSVRSYDLKTEYSEALDYEYDATTNTIQLKTGTKIPYFTESEYYPSTEIPGSTLPCAVPGISYIRFSEGDYFCSRQIAVTYRHGGEKHLPAPKNQSKAFANTLQKLKEDKEVKILFYGDSITVGGNSSGFLNVEPHADVWTKMVFDSLVKDMGATNAKYINTAVGGWRTQDGLQNLDEKVIAYKPDAVFIGFGMNDGDKTPKKHIAEIAEMVERIRGANPKTEICLISTMLPNQAVKGFYGNQAYFSEAYAEYVEECKENGDTSICFADVTKMHTALLEIKRYYDMTGNNVNHVNDFMARVYAQTVFQTVCGYSF